MHFIDLHVDISNELVVSDGNLVIVLLLCDAHLINLIKNATRTLLIGFILPYQTDAGVSYNYRMSTMWAMDSNKLINGDR